MGLGGTPVIAEVFARRSGVFVGVEDVKRLLADKDVKMSSLDEGEEFDSRKSSCALKELTMSLACLKRSF